MWHGNDEKGLGFFSQPNIHALLKVTGYCEVGVVLNKNFLPFSSSNVQDLQL